MKILSIFLNETTGMYTIVVDAIIKYECVAADEVALIVKEIMEETMEERI